MNEVHSIIQERFKKLPAPIQDKVTSPDTQRLIQAIGKRYTLHIDEMGVLENEVLIVLLGLELPQDLPHNLVKSLRLKEEDAYSIAEEVNEKILQPLREDFKLLYKKDIVEAEDALRTADPTSLDATEVGTLAHELPESVYSEKREAKAQPKVAESKPERAYEKASLEAERLKGKAHLPTEEREVTSLKAPGDVPAAEASTTPPAAPDPYREPIS